MTEVIDVQVADSLAAYHDLNAMPRISLRISDDGPIPIATTGAKQ